MSDYRAKRTPVHLGPAAWSVILGPQEPARPLDESVTADVAIIGGGFAGLSAARRLTELAPGAKVIVLEAARLAEGSAGRNSGFMIDLPHDLASDDYAGSGDDRAVIALNRRAIAFAGDAVNEYGIDRNYFDPAGKVNGATGAAAHTHNESYARHLATLGEACETLDRRQMHDMTGSRHYISGLYTPGTVMLQPAGYIRGLGAGLVARGVAIHENSPVLAFEKQGGAWRVRTPRGVVSAAKLILSVNGHLESFGFARGRLLHVFLYAAMTTRLDAAALARLGGRPRWGVTPSDPIGTTVRRIDAGQGGDRIVTRTCATLRPDMIPDAAAMRRAERVIRRKFDQRFPQLAGVAMEHAWAGLLCLSRNGVAVMREIENGVFAACVQNGLGATRGTLTGIGAAELACAETSPVTAHFLAEPQPTRLPPPPLQAIGGNALLRWKEWRARGE